MLRVRCIAIAFLITLGPALNPAPAAMAETVPWVLEPVHFQDLQHEDANETLEILEGTIHFTEDPEGPDSQPTLVIELLEAEEADSYDDAANKRSRLRTFLKGKKSRNALYGGMWTTHMGTDKEYEENNRLLALQYQGIFLATFRNSHADQTVAAGVARTVAEKTFGENLEVDAGYKVGPMYGYKQGVPTVAGVSVLPFVTMGVSYKAFGVDLNYVPFTNVASLNTRINLTPLFSRRNNKEDDPGPEETTPKHPAEIQ